MSISVLWRYDAICQFLCYDGMMLPVNSPPPPDSSCLCLPSVRTHSLGQIKKIKIMLHRLSGTVSLLKLDHRTQSHLSNHHWNFTSSAYAYSDSVCVCMCVCVCVRACVRACARVCVCVCAHTHTHTHTHIHTHTHTHTHARSRARTHTRSRSHTHARSRKFVLAVF